MEEMRQTPLRPFTRVKLLQMTRSGPSVPSMTYWASASATLWLRKRTVSTVREGSPGLVAVLRFIPEVVASIPRRHSPREVS